MRYKVGDVVKLRDDLEDGECYGSSDYIEEMGIMKNKPIIIFKIPNLFKDCYEVVDEIGENWYISDEMIEGLWEECKGIAYEPYEEKTNKLKLIDVLNKIANGELKEGTKVIFEDIEMIYKDGDLEHEDGYSICCIMHNSKDLFSEVELIEPDHFTDVGKMAECKHEWENYAMYNPNTGETKDFRKCAKCDLEEDIEPTDNTTEKIEELDEKYIPWLDLVKDINKIIRKLNAHSIVLLAQEKDINEIKEQLDY